MTYTYPIDAQEMFVDRTEQFVGFGIARPDVERVRAAVTDMWCNNPGGWPYEWSRLASEYAAAGQHGLAALAYGCAKFPCLVDDGRLAAFGHQLAEYQQSAPSFRARFARRVVAGRVPYGMVDIVGNALGFVSQPPVDKVLAAAGPLDRRQLLTQPSNSHMLVINGADDNFIPQSATLAFEGRPDTEVHLVPGTGHCAMTKAAEIVPQMIGWLGGAQFNSREGSRR